MKVLHPSFFNFLIIPKIASGERYKKNAKENEIFYIENFLVNKH